MPDKKLIFHVEDNPDNRLLVRRLLFAFGYDVVEAENAAEALEKLKTIHPDLILMDINMPDMDGYTLTIHIKANPALMDVPVIAITANAMKGDRERCLAAGMNDYISKPVNLRALTAIIQNHLSRDDKAARLH